MEDIIVAGTTAPLFQDNSFYRSWIIRCPGIFEDSVLRMDEIRLLSLLNLMKILFEMILETLK